MSSIYAQASRIIQQFWEKKASLKTLVYESSSSKKGYLLAICSKTLRAQGILDEIVNAIPEFHEMDIRNKSLFYVMLYDEIFGEGIRGGGQVAKAIHAAKASIDSFLNNKMKEMNVQTKEELLPEEKQIEKWKFARVNRVKTTPAEVLSILKQVCSIEQQKELGIDDLISCIVHIPQSLDLHDHPLIQSHSLILQTKASCLPPYFLLQDLYDTPTASSPCFDVIDATAAPGNKTTFLGDILRNRGTVYAFDRDERRFHILESRCTAYGVGNIHCIHGDFLQSNPFDQQFKKVQRIQLDPSCSGSGMSHTSLDTSKPSTQRLKSLTDFQLACILHAAEFPHVTRISYSTCSIYEEEDEKVVARALAELNKETKTWYIATVKSSLPSHGHKVDGLSEEETNHVIRCEMGDGLGQGFFVCVFAREHGLSEEECKRAEEVYWNKKQMKNMKVEEEEKPISIEKPVDKKKKEKRKNPSVSKQSEEKKEKAPVDYVAKIKSIKKTKHGKKVPLL